MPVNTKNFLNKFIISIKKGLEVTTSQKNMRLIGERMIQLIVIRTQRGLGVAKTGGAEIPLKALSQNYIDFRRKNQRSLDPTTSATRSNLTFSGAMLRSMSVQRVSQGVVNISPSNARRKGGITNAQIAEYVQARRPFNNLSKKEIDTVRQFVEEILQLEISKI